MPTWFNLIFRFVRDLLVSQISKNLPTLPYLTSPNLTLPSLTLPYLNNLTSFLPSLAWVLAHSGCNLTWAFNTILLQVPDNLLQKFTKIWKNRVSWPLNFRCASLNNWRWLAKMHSSHRLTIFLKFKFKNNFDFKAFFFKHKNEYFTSYDHIGYYFLG